MPDPERDQILDPKLRSAERKPLLDTARLLEQARPVPRPAFRGALAKRLRARSAERERLHETARLLEQARPVPRPAFRGALARRLQERYASPWRPRLLIPAYTGSGLALLAMVAIGLAGVGPLASG